MIRVTKGRPRRLGYAGLSSLEILRGAPSTDRTACASPRRGSDERGGEHWGVPRPSRRLDRRAHSARTKPETGGMDTRVEGKHPVDATVGAPNLPRLAHAIGPHHLGTGCDPIPVRRTGGSRAAGEESGVPSGEQLHAANRPETSLE